MWKRCAIGLMVLMIFTIQIAIASAAEHAHAALANDSGGLSHQELSTEEIENVSGSGDAVMQNCIGMALLRS